MTDNWESVSKEYLEISEEYSRPSSTVDSGELYYIADKLHEQLTTTQQKLDTAVEALELILNLYHLCHLDIQLIAKAALDNTRGK